MTRRRGRVSLVKENRIAQLHEQGYDPYSIGLITNVRPGLVNTVVRRVRRRWLYPDDPRMGRKRGFLSDREIEQIRDLRHTSKMTFAEIGKIFYGLDPGSVRAICLGITYVEPCGDRPEDEFDYTPNFMNRLRRNR